MACWQSRGHFSVMNRKGTEGDDEPKITEFIVTQSQNTERGGNLSALSLFCRKFDAFQVVDIKDVKNTASDASLKIPVESNRFGGGKFDSALRANSIC